MTERVSFLHSPDFLRAIVETSCTSDYLFALQTIESNPRLRYLPVMITRLMLSLRKTNVSQERGWRLGEPTTYTTIRFADHRDGTSMGDEIALGDLRARTGGLEIEPDGVNDITGDLSSSLHRERALDDLAP